MRKDLLNNKEWLYKKYVIDKLSSLKIAKECECNKTTILNYLKKYNIERRSISEASISRKLSEETKQKISKATAGRNNPFYGKKHSKDTKQKMSDAWTLERKQDFSEKNKGENNPCFGKHITEEHKQKISEFGKGRKHSKETIQKMSKA